MILEDCCVDVATIFISIRDAQFLPRDGEGANVYVCKCFRLSI